MSFTSVATQNRTTLTGRYQDPDGTRKYIFKTERGVLEIAHIRNRKDREVFCVPSMYSCRLGCTFCHLTTKKIQPVSGKVHIEELEDAMSLIERNQDVPLLVSVMGVGDGSQNIDLIRGLREKDYYVSVASIVPTLSFIDKLEEIGGVKLHFSLHNSIEEERKQIMPATRGCPSLEKTIERVSSYASRVSPPKPFVTGDGREIEIYSRGYMAEVHYTLIEDVNDSPVHVSSLSDILLRSGLPIKFLQFKPSLDYVPSASAGKVATFLKDSGVKVKEYNPPGQEIQTSCGQFTPWFYENRPEYAEERKEYERKFAF